MRIVSLTAALCALLLLMPPPASACSKRSLWAPIRDGMAYFVGTATTDTLPAGPGSVRYGVGGGHFGRAVERPIYGQVVAIDALDGPAAEGLTKEAREVVVVPWDYDAACRPLGWGRSARWVPPGTRAFYLAELRAREHWVEGKPTFDLHNPGDLPYTGTEAMREMSSETPVDSMLTPGQLFDLYRALPAADEVEQGGVAALGALREWIDRNPDLPGRPPAEWLVSSVVRSADRVELSRADSPVHGTWRFQIRLPDGSTRVVYGRTEPRSLELWSPALTRAQRPPEQLRLPPPEALGLMITFADAVEALPETLQPRNFEWGRITTVARPNSASSAEHTWAGWLEASFLGAALEGHPIARQVRVQELERYRARAQAGLPQAMPATFTRGADGVLRVRQSYPLEGGTEVVVEGEQLSRQVVRRPG